jgi:hypothetical protein
MLENALFYLVERNIPLLCALIVNKAYGRLSVCVILIVVRLKSSSAIKK